MSRARTLKNYDEAIKIVDQFFMDRHMLTVAMMQFAEREKIRVLNNYRKKLGLPLIDAIKEPTMFPGGEKFEWIIDPPTPRYNDIDKPLRNRAKP